MTSFSTPRGHWKLRLSGAFWLALVLFAGAGFVVVRHLPAWMIAVIVAAGVVIGTLGFLIRWRAKRRERGYSPRRSFTAFATAGALAVVGLVSLPIWYLAAWVQSGPTAVPLATLSNGQKTVVFQGMQHVASEEFYKSVVFDLEQALVDGYTLFYEGVQPVPARPDLTDWFNKTLRGSDADLSASYVQLADECGLKFQLSYFQPLLADQAIHPSRHVTADVSFLDMKTEYERLMRDDAAFATAMADKIAKRKADAGGDPFAPVLEALGSATPGQKQLIGIVCRGVLGMAMSGRLGDKNDPTQRIILDLRNRALARFVADSTASKIYITYGAAHLPGFVEELRKLDASFSIRAVKAVRPMTLPDEANLARSALHGLQKN